MADDEDLKEKVKEVLKEKDADAALELLTDDGAYSIGKNERNRLAVLALSEYIAPYYTKIVGLISGDTVKRLSEDLGRHGDPETILEVLEDPEHKKQHDSIVSAAIANEKVDIAQLYPLAINSASNEVKDTLNTALGRDKHVSNEDLAMILGDPGFRSHQSVILKHVEARMDAEELEEFLEEARSGLPQNEIERLEKAIERKKRYAHE